jgi:hypothetical protein
MSLDELAKRLEAGGYERSRVHAGRLFLAITNQSGTRWRGDPDVVNGIAAVLGLDSQESAELMDAYLFRPGSGSQ